MSVALSVVVPAHDEATIIGPLLRELAADPLIEIVVAANGCTDDTVGVARASAPRGAVLEVPTAGKPSALNAGDEAATAWPRVYLDADVRVAAGTLRRLAEQMDAHGGAIVAAPRLEVELSGCSVLVRAHYRIWELTDYRMRAHVGSGLYALSAAGRARFAHFPSVIADDLYVQTRFTEDERLVTDGVFVVPAPRTFRALLRRGERIALGNLELEAHGETVGEGGGGRALLGRVFRRPALWPSFAVYLVGRLIVRGRARRRWRRGELSAWNRDETTRVAR